MKLNTRDEKAMKKKEIISLSKFKTIDALKSEIRNKIARKNHGKISSQGSLISISFEKNGNKRYGKGATKCEPQTVINPSLQA